MKISVTEIGPPPPPTVPPPPIGGDPSPPAWVVLGEPVVPVAGSARLGAATGRAPVRRACASNRARPPDRRRRLAAPTARGLAQGDETGDGLGLPGALGSVGRGEQRAEHLADGRVAGRGVGRVEAAQQPLTGALVERRRRSGPRPVVVDHCATVPCRAAPA